MHSLRLSPSFGTSQSLQVTRLINLHRWLACQSTLKPDWQCLTVPPCKHHSAQYVLLFRIIIIIIIILLFNALKCELWCSSLILTRVWWLAAVALVIQSCGVAACCFLSRGPSPVRLQLPDCPVTKSGLTKKPARLRLRASLLCLLHDQVEGQVGQMWLVAACFCKLLTTFSIFSRDLGRLLSIRPETTTFLIPVACKMNN